jgi:hypothetical protein
VKVVPVAEEMDRSGQFAEVGCNSLDFHFRVAKDKFKSEEFLESMRTKGFNNLPQRWATTCLTQSLEADYHVHFGWNETEEKQLELWASYHRGHFPRQEGEKEPYAEQFMQWLGQFFVGDYANVDIQGRFGYPNDVRNSRYLLPVKVSIVPGLDTTIDGISIDFPSRPNGIGTARITVGIKNLTIVFSGLVKLKFDDFNVFEHLSNLSVLASSLTDVRKPS